MSRCEGLFEVKIQHHLQEFYSLCWGGGGGGMTTVSSYMLAVHGGGACG